MNTLLWKYLKKKKEIKKKKEEKKGERENTPGPLRSSDVDK